MFLLFPCDCLSASYSTYVELFHFNTSEETDDFYEFTTEDYYRILATKKEGNIEFILDMDG